MLWLKFDSYYAIVTSELKESDDKPLYGCYVLEIPKKSKMCPFDNSQYPTIYITNKYPGCLAVLGFRDSFLFFGC